MSVVITGTFLVPVHADSEKHWNEIQYKNADRIVGLHLSRDDTYIPDFYETLNCNNMIHLAYFDVDPANPMLSSYNGCLYDKKKTLLICFPQGLKSTSIPSTCVNVLPQALYGKSSSVRRQVMAIVAENNGGEWPGFYRYVNNETTK